MCHSLGQTLSCILFYIMLKRTNKTIYAQSCHRDLIFKHNGENPAVEQKHLRILHPSLTQCQGLFRQLPIDFSFVPSFNLVQYFSNLSVQNNHCYRYQILLTVLHGQFQDISRVFSGPLGKLEQVEPSTDMSG